MMFGLPDFYSASSLKQQSEVRHVAPPKNHIPIPSKPGFSLISYCGMLSGEAINTNLIVFSSTRLGNEHTV